jgi:hypothetical protein
VAHHHEPHPHCATWEGCSRLTEMDASRVTGELMSALDQLQPSQLQYSHDFGSEVRGSCGTRGVFKTTEGACGLGRVCLTLQYCCLQDATEAEEPMGDIASSTTSLGGEHTFFHVPDAL